MDRLLKSLPDTTMCLPLLAVHLQCEQDKSFFRFINLLEGIGKVTDVLYKEK